MIIPAAAPTVTDPVSAPEGTVINCGSVKMDRLAVIKTAAPPVGAAAERVTVQVMLDPEASGVAGHVSAVSWTAPIIWIGTAADDPFHEAVTVTFRLDATHPPAEIPTKAACCPEGMVTEAGMLRPEPAGATANATTAPPAGAAAESVTVQAIAPQELNVVAGHVSDVTVAVVVVVVSAIEAVADDPFHEAVIVTFWAVVMVPAPITTEPLVEPAGMVTDAGGFALPVGLAAIATTAPPDGAGAESITVQVMLDPEVSGVAGHVNDVTVAVVVVVVSAIEAVADDPFSEAVIVVAELTANTPVLRVNDPLDTPCGTRMDAGRVAAGELDASRTVAPPVPAAPLRVTEQAVELEGVSELLLQVTAVTCTSDAGGPD